MSAVLDWALVDGKPIHASVFVGVTDRPAAVCPCCGEAIAWKAGKQIAPHVAHLPGSICATTNPETAEHYNAKMRLAQTLGGLECLRVATKCRNGHPVVTAWNVGAWTRAVPEMRVGNRRPDVVLVKDSDSGNDFEVAAIEVLRSHEVDREKAADLATMGLRWVEVTAADALAWDGKSPLPLFNFDNESWSEFDADCAKCQEIAEWRKRQSELEARKATRADWEEWEVPETNWSEWDAFVRCFEWEQRRAKYAAKVNDRRAQVEQLRANPPRIHIAVAIAMVNNPGVAAIGTCLMRDGHPIRTAMIDCEIGNGAALWLALLHAIERLESVSLGTAAVFHINTPDIAENAMKPRYPVEFEDEDEAVRRRVSEAVERGGHLVVADSTRKTPLSPGAAWILKAHDAAESLLIERSAREAV